MQRIGVVCKARLYFFFQISPPFPSLHLLPPLCGILVHTPRPPLHIIQIYNKVTEEESRDNFKQLTLTEQLHL